MGADFATHLTDILTLRVAEIGRGRAFHGLLAAPMDGTVAFVKVIDAAVAVAKDLLVLVRIDGDGLCAHFVHRVHDADGNLAPVCDQDLLELGCKNTSCFEDSTAFR